MLLKLTSSALHMTKLPPKSIIAIGLVSLLINTSSVIVYSLTPIYLTTVLGLSALSLGMLEGAVEMMAWSSRIVSGVITDYFQKRKPILFIAYLAITISRPIFAIATGVYTFFFARSIDRISNGFQATARDSLIGDIAKPGARGAAYGLRQSLSVTGSLLGGVLALILLKYWNVSYTNIFYLATIPAVAAVAVLTIFVKDTTKKNAEIKKKSVIKPILELFKGNVTFWKIILIASIFMLGNYSGFFAILHAKNITHEDSIAPILMIFQNLGGMLSAYPIGYYSDKGHRNILLGCGFIIAIISNLFFSMATNGMTILIAATLWGIQMGITQSLFAAKIADSTHKSLRGSAFGVYYLIAGCMIFLSNTLIGWGFDNLSAELPFYISSCFMLMALFTLLIQSRLSAKA